MKAVYFKMNKRFLDNYVVLYSGNKDHNLFNLILDIENEQSATNVWEFAGMSNITNTDHIVGQKVINLFNMAIQEESNPYRLIDEKLITKKNKLKHELNKYSFNFLLDYIEEYELLVKKIKEWSIYEQISGSNFHNDKDRDGRKHSYTILIALNDDYTGGEIQFDNRIGNECIKMSKGDILIYPSNDNYRHKENIVTSGKKYLAIAYF